MRITMNRSLVVHGNPAQSTPETTYNEGEQYDVDDVMGRQWTHAGIATIVPPASTEAQ